MTDATSTFKTVKQFTLDANNTRITKYASEKTGLSVVVVDVDSPIVNGFFVVATETNNDKGCPHVLEHLVFLGSEDYPYKGVLDTLSNRCLAQGTNAWTAVDHTCYTISTAGEEGFLSILPVYLDHILFPTLTDSGHYTEVHHVNGNGENAGVVYCEMQGRQNTQEDLIHLQIQRNLYQGSGYAYETGGLMEGLRELTADEVRQYHRDYYRPDNLCLVITGRVNHQNLLRALQPMEDKIIRKNIQKGLHKRPWVDSRPLTPYTENKEEIIEFPDEEEAVGSVYLSWRTHKYGQHVDAVALNVIHTYLTDSSVSLLRKEFTELQDPYCADVSFAPIDSTERGQMLCFDNVPVDKLHQIKSRFFDVMKRLCSDGVDMERLKLVIERDRLKILSDFETNPHHYLTDLIIGDVLYGDREGNNLELCVDELRHLEVIAKWTRSDWTSFIQKYFLDPPYYCAIGKPSNKLATHLQESEKSRLESQRLALGETKLKELDEALEKAQELNEVEIPEELIENFAVPSYANIEMPQVITAIHNHFAPHSHHPQNNEVQKHIATKTAPQLFIQFNQIKSSFIEVTAVADTLGLSSDLRPYLEVLLEAFFNFPVKMTDGSVLQHEDVVSALNRDTVEYSCCVGHDHSSFSCGPFGQVLNFVLKVESSKYPTAIQWLNTLFYHQVPTIERLRIATAKLLTDLSPLKRDGFKMTAATLNYHLFDNEKSNNSVMGVIQQTSFLKGLLEKLDNEPEKVLKDIQQLRNVLFHRENLRMHVAGNILGLKDPLGIWNEKFSGVSQSQDGHKSLSPIRFAHEFLSPIGQSLNHHTLLVMPSIESSFAIHVTPGPKSFDDEDVMPLAVLNEMLSTMEGVFWKAIRGTGLAYGAHVTADMELGFVRFVVYRSQDAAKAFEAAKRIVEKLVQDDNENEHLEHTDDDEEVIVLDELEFESAKASVAFTIIDKEDNSSNAASEVWMNTVLKGVGAEYNRKMLNLLDKVTMDDIRRVLKKYIVPLFDPKTSASSIVSAPNKVDEIKGGYESVGFQLQIKKIDELVQGDEDDVEMHDECGGCCGHHH